MDRVGLGFAGVGWLGESLIKELGAFPGLQLAAVQDQNVELAEGIASRYGAPRCFASFDALLADQGVDAVVISTPNCFHGPQARQALGAGKHVLVQKPLGVSFADAAATIGVAERAPGLLFVDYTYRFLETTKAFLRAAANLGTLRSLSAEFHNVYGPGKAWFFDPALSGGGALMDLGVHLFDLCLGVAGPGTARVETSELRRAEGQQVEQWARVELRANGVPCTVEVGWNTPIPQTIIRVQARGEAGEARWENVDGSFFRFRAVAGETLLGERETPLRSDTLAAFQECLRSGSAPAANAEVYRLIDDAYARGG